MRQDRAEFWERSDVVAEFAAREPDERLPELLARLGSPTALRALDVGCAAGRNTIWLAREGVDVHAVDASAAMVAETRRRLAAVLGPTEAEARVRRGRMDDLSGHADGRYDLVLSLGVLQNASSTAEWERAVAELARVLAPGGLLYVGQFTPETNLAGGGVRPVAGERCLYEGLSGRRAVLVWPEELEAELRRHGLRPAGKPRKRVTERGNGCRVGVDLVMEKRTGDRLRFPCPR